jgi:hypothetical protein
MPEIVNENRLAVVFIIAKFQSIGFKVKPNKNETVLVHNTKKYNEIRLSFFFFVVLALELRASCLQGRHLPLEPFCQPFFVLGIFKMVLGNNLLKLYFFIYYKFFIRIYS